ncbi:MAG: hypothetical protein IJM34_04820 [Lachnospiraceae bacterium]|nr:hypothetical protein [Lachnospiraceae bacterium]
MTDMAVSDKSMIFAAKATLQKRLKIWAYTVDNMMPAKQESSALSRFFVLFPEMRQRKALPQKKVVIKIYTHINSTETIIPPEGKSICHDEYYTIREGIVQISDLFAMFKILDLFDSGEYDTIIVDC